MQQFSIVRAIRWRVPLLALAVLAGCGSQIDDVPPPDVRASQLSPGGVYAGQITSQKSGVTTLVTALIDDHDPSDSSNIPTNILYYANDGSFLATGVYTALTSTVNAQLRDFQLTGPATAPLTLSITGGYQAQSAVSANYSRADGDSGSLSLTYVAADYEVRSATSLLAGQWVVADSFGVLDISFSLDVNGDVSGQDFSTACSYNGNVTVVDLRFNVYQVNLVETCGAAGVPMSGLATLLPANTTSATPETLVLAVASATSARLFRLHPAS